MIDLLEAHIREQLDEANQNLILSSIQKWDQKRLLEFTAYWEGKRDALSVILAKLTELKPLAL